MLLRKIKQQSSPRRWRATPLRHMERARYIDSPAQPRRQPFWRKRHFPCQGNLLRNFGEGKTTIIVFCRRPSNASAR